MLGAGQRARRPLSVGAGDGARASWVRGSGRDARSRLGLVTGRGHRGRDNSAVSRFLLDDGALAQPLPEFTKLALQLGQVVTR